MAETIRIHKKSELTGKQGYMDLPITPEQIARWMGGELIQRVFPKLTSDQREFLISGAQPGEWEEIFKDE